MKTLFSFLVIVAIFVLIGSCSRQVLYKSKQDEVQPSPTPAEPCVAERIDEGVRITCPTSEAVIYDGEAGTPAEPGKDGKDGKDGTACVVQPDGLIRCGKTTYQLPVTTPDECNVFILPKE